MAEATDNAIATVPAPPAPPIQIAFDALRAHTGPDKSVVS